MTNRRGKSGSSDRFYFLGLQNHWGWWLQPWNEKVFTPWTKSYNKPRQRIKNQRRHFANKDLYSQSFGFSSNLVWIWELEHKEGWAPKNWCFQIVLEKNLKSLLDCKIRPVNPKENQPWIFMGRRMLKLKLQYFGHLMQRADSLEKTLILWKTEGKRRRWRRMVR